MNKILKLPLFLGIAGAACAGVLAGVYSVTSPIVLENQEIAAKQAYISMYREYDVVADDIVPDESELSSDLYNAGCTGRVFVNKAKGIAYDCEKNGRNGPVKFQIAFAEGKYIGYTDIANSETKSYYENFLKKVKAFLSSKPSAETNAFTPEVYSGSTETGTPLSETIEACRVDYMAWYAENK